MASSSLEKWFKGLEKTIVGKWTGGFTIEIRNATSVHVRVLVHEDPEGFVAAASVFLQGGLLWGHSGHASLAQYRPRSCVGRGPQDVSIDPYSAEVVSVQSSTPFITAAFVMHRGGPPCLRVIWMNRAFAHTEDVLIEPRHLSIPCLPSDVCENLLEAWREHMATTSDSSASTPSSALSSLHSASSVLSQRTPRRHRTVC